MMLTPLIELITCVKQFRLGRNLGILSDLSQLDGLTVGEVEHHLLAHCGPRLTLSIRLATTQRQAIATPR